MRKLSLVVLALLLFSSGCETQSKQDKPSAPHAAAVPEEPAAKRAQQSQANAIADRARVASSTFDEASSISLTNVSSIRASAEAFDRKIIRNAELALETESPTDGLRKISAAAEQNGGFVVTSEVKQDPTTPGAKPRQTVTVIARVPAMNFNSAIEQIRQAGERVVAEKTTGQDVSEEYLDLEARLRTKKALEQQFLEIMKQARKVQDALDVQNQLSEVRTDIERLEGRRRFLENQSALSTITTTLQMPAPIVAATADGFGTSVKRAFGDSIDIAAAILLFVVQAVIVLLPVVLLFGVPAWLGWKLIRRRLAIQKADAPVVPNQ